MGITPCAGDVTTTQLLPRDRARGAQTSGPWHCTMLARWGLLAWRRRAGRRGGVGAQAKMFHLKLPEATEPTTQALESDRQTQAWTSYAQPRSPSEPQSSPL